MAGGIGNIANLLGKVNSANALVVTLSGGTASASQFLAGDGSAAAPSYTFTNFTTTGWFASAGPVINGSIGGTNTHLFSSVGYTLASNSAVISLGAAADLLLTREAAAVLQLGADAAGVTAQTLKGPDRITSDGVGGNLTIAGGRNRGASAGGSLIFQTSPAAGAGVTGTLATRLTLDSTGTALFTGPVSVFRTETPEATDSNVTYSTAQVLGGIITRSNMGSNRVDAFPTAANLVAAIPGCVVGTSFDVIVNNNDTAQTVTVNGASVGITYEGTATAIAAAEARLFRVLITNVTGAAEAATVFQVV